MTIRLLKPLALAAIAGVFMWPSVLRGESISARWVVTELDPAQRYLYALAVIETLAYARYLRDRPSRRGTDCITDWFQREINISFWPQLHKKIRKYPDQPMSVLVYMISIDHCGK